MADDEAASDIFELRARQVRLAVDVLVLALGGEGATFQRQVQAWLAGLDPRARKLAAFPPALKQAGSRLSGLPAQAARTTLRCWTFHSRVGISVTHSRLHGED